MLNVRIFSTLLLITALTAVTAAGSEPSDGFAAEEVEVWNPVDSIRLAGTLTVPTHSPKGAVVLATGSGLQNRDEEAFSHRPFKVLAEHLSVNGFAVLRMDDRGFGQSEGAELIATSTTDDFARDIACGLDFVRSRFPNLPAGVLGHSEGGTIAIKLASNPNTRCDFIITLAAPAWSGDSIIMSQSRAIATQMTGRWDGEQAERKILDIAKSPLPQFVKRANVSVILNETLGEVAKIPEVQQSLKAQLDVMVSPYYVAMLTYDPSADIRSINVPWLALNGDKDLQVLPANLHTISRLNPSATTVMLPNHNHMFQNCTTGLMQEYPLIPEDLSQQTLNEVTDWLLRTF